MTEPLLGYLTEEQEAEALNVTVTALRAWRKLRKGPPHTIGGNQMRQVLYPIAGTKAWLASLVFDPQKATQGKKSFGAAIRQRSLLR